MSKNIRDKAERSTLVEAMRSTAAKRMDPQRHSAMETAGVIAGIAFGALSLLLFGLRKVQPSAPRDLYDEVWEKVWQTFFDQTRLTDWQEWRHRFDEQIASDEDAIRYANVMLASLNDRYTRLLTPAEQADDEVRAHDEHVVSASLLASGIAYVRISSFASETTAKQLSLALKSVLKRQQAVSVESLRDMAEIGEPDGPMRVIIDLRNNGGGLIQQAIDASTVCIEQGVIVRMKTRIANKGYAKDLVSVNKSSVVTKTENGDGSRTQREHERFQNLLSAKRIVILVDEFTASAAEMFAATVKDNTAAIVVGMPTRGKGIGQSFFTMGQRQAELEVTTLVYHTPKGVWLGDAGQTHASGLVPDVTAPSLERIADLCAPNDEQFAAAVKILSK